MSVCRLVCRVACVMVHRPELLCLLPTINGSFLVLLRKVCQLSILVYLTLIQCHLVHMYRYEKNCALYGQLLFLLYKVILIGS